MKINIVQAILIATSTVTGMMYWNLENKIDNLNIYSLGAYYGCSDLENPFPVKLENEINSTRCWSTRACPNFLYDYDPHCHGEYVIDPNFTKEMRESENKRKTLLSQQETIQTIGIFSIYLVLGWFANNLLFAILQRFLTLKWASLISLFLNVCILNALGIVMSLVGILKLPKLAEEGNKTEP